MDYISRWFPAESKISTPAVCDTTQGDINYLPHEVKHAICSHLNSRDLLLLSEVSTEWKGMCEDDVLWKFLFDCEKTDWDVFENTADSSRSMWNKFSKYVQDVGTYLAEGEEANASRAKSHRWRALYLQHHTRYLTHKPVQPPPSSAASSAQVGNWRNQKERFTKIVNPILHSLRVRRVPMLGDGLDSTSKDILYSMMFNPAKFTVTGLYAGVEGMGSGVGFRVGSVNLNIAALHRSTTRGVFDQIRPQWLTYFQGAEGVVYVLNTKNIPKSETSKLMTIVGGEKPLVPPSAPLLVLLVHDDPLAPTMRPSDVADLLELNTLENRAWCVRVLDMETLDGMTEGLQWLSSKF